MTPFLRWLRRTRERLFGTWVEGPEPPDRLRTMVLLFANARPFATRQEWVDFAAHHAGECYRTGYLRGLERGERDEGAQPWRESPPEQVADALMPGWRRSLSVFVPNADHIAADEE